MPRVATAVAEKTGQGGRARLSREARREAILDVAQEVFLEEGFSAASMSRIAARLGGSKATLYQYFQSKEDLFTAYVERRGLWRNDRLAVLLEGETAEQALQRAGAAYLGDVLSDRALRGFRLVTAEAGRAPSLGRRFYEAGPRRTVACVADLIAKLQAAGSIDVDDPVAAAEQFLGLLQCRHFKARLCNAIAELAPEEIATESRRATATFLRLYLPRS